MYQENWISTKERLPKEGDSVVLTMVYNGSRQFWVVKDAGNYMRDGKLYFGKCECDYWQPIELIGD